MSPRRSPVGHVLITEDLHVPTELVRFRPNTKYEPGLWQDRGALLQAAAGCIGIVVRNRTAVDRQLLEAAPTLQVIGRLGAGMDNLDVDALLSHGIPVVHGGGLNARSVAEFVVGVAIALAHGIIRADREVHRGLWVRRPGIQLQHKIMGLVGLGRIGNETARLARGLGMKVVAYDPYVNRAAGRVQLVRLSELLAMSDVVSVHVPLTVETRHLIGRAELASLHDGAVIINVSRGPVLDEAALLEELRAGRLAGAALDVRDVEGPTENDEFWELDNVLLTPHVAGLTVDSQLVTARSVLRDVYRVLAGLAPRGPVLGLKS